MRGIFGLAAVALLAAGCAGPAATPAPTSKATATPAPTTTTRSVALSVGNGTTMSVVLVVNGRALATFAPAAAATVDPSVLPQLPWSVSATTASGRVLATAEVSLADAAVIEQAAQAERSGGLFPGPVPIPMGRAYLSCGTLTVWAGVRPPSGPIPPTPVGSAGDCQP